MDQTELFQAERPRLVQVASRDLRDRAEAEDVVQLAWLRMHRTDAEIDNLPAWLTTVTTRLCLDQGEGDLLERHHSLPIVHLHDAHAART